MKITMKFIKKITALFLGIGCLACSQSVRKITSNDKNFTFDVPNSFRQTDKGHPVITAFINGNYKFDVWAKEKTLYEGGIQQFFDWNFNREQLIFFRKITPIEIDFINKNGYQILAFYGEGQDPSGLFGPMNHQGYAYLIETPDFFVRVRLVHSSMRTNALNKEKAVRYMRVVLENFQQN